MIRSKESKIVFIHLNNDYSGSTKVLSEVIDLCSGNNIANDLYHGPSNEGFLNNKGQQKFTLPYKRFNNKYLTLTSYIYSQIFLFFKMFRYIRTDTKFYINTMLPFGAALSGKLMGKKVYFHIHETSIKPDFLKFFLKTIIKLTATKIIFVSKFLINKEPISGIPSEVIYNSISEDFVSEARKDSYSIEGVNFNVMMACSLKEYKGISEFLEIAKLSIPNKNIFFELVLNASDIEVDAYFYKKEVPKNITLFSKQSDLSIFYKKANLVLNLSRVDEWVETFGLTILEAMCYGIPVIAPPVGGPLEIVRDKIDGYLISSYQHKEIAQCIRNLSENHGLCLELSKNCLQQAKKFNNTVFNTKITKFLLDQ